MKKAQVVPIHKENSILDKSNYRPVSILPVMSKVFERTIYDILISLLIPFLVLLDLVMVVILPL
jgi:hypothetical protein